MFARFEHHGVAGGEGPGQRGEQQLQRVVPRADHQHHPQRGQLCPGLGRLDGERHRDRARPQPGLKVLFQVRGFGGDEADFRQQGLGGVLAQVAGQCFGELRAALGQHPAQAAELLQPPGQRTGGSGVVEFTGAGDGGGNGLHPPNVPAPGAPAGWSTG